MSSHDEDEPEVEEEVKTRKPRTKRMKQTSDDEDEDAPRSRTRKARKKKDKNAPKGVKSAYTYFGEEHRARLKEEGLAFGDVSKKLGTMWKELPESDKVKYHELAEQDKERHRTEMEAYNKNKPVSDEE